MSTYLDFEMVLSPNIHQQGEWNILLKDCPVPHLPGLVETVHPQLTQANLDRLRSRYGWPNAAELRGIGDEVWRSFMTPQIRTAFLGSLAAAKLQNCGVRIIFSIVGEEPQHAVPGAILLQELPVEAMYDDTLSFVAPNPVTPVSRSLSFKPDIDPLVVSLPLRILAVISTPSDKPKANFAAEKQALEESLETLAGVGTVELEFCQPATVKELQKRLEHGFQVLHFVGHGAFDTVGDDPSPRPHLCFMDDNGESDLIDDDKLTLILQESSVRLVVLSACSSAAPTAEEALELQNAVRPFDGVAQRLISGTAGVSAVVAMQFDLEDQAAIEFSKAFYTNLLKDGCALDETVALGRKAVATTLDPGHRAWITPVLYWRSKGCKVFEIGRGKPPDVTVLIDKIQAAIQIYLTNIAGALNTLAAYPGAAAALIQSWLPGIEKLQQEQRAAIGECLRLVGGPAAPGGTTRCRLALTLQTPAAVGDVRFRLSYPDEQVAFANALPGQDSGVIYQQAGPPSPGSMAWLVQNASGGSTWPPGEYELALLDFQLTPDALGPFWIKLSDMQAMKNGADTHLDAVHAIACAIP